MRELRVRGGMQGESGRAPVLPLPLLAVALTARSVSDVPSVSSGTPAVARGGYPFVTPLRAVTLAGSATLNISVMITSDAEIQNGAPGTR